MTIRQERSNLALAAAVRYYAAFGRVFIPVGDSGRYDFLVDTKDKILRIQVKYTSRTTSAGNFIVALATRTCRKNGERLSFNYVQTDFDFMFVLCSDGSEHVVSINEVIGKDSYVIRRVSSSR